MVKEWLIFCNLYNLSDEEKDFIDKEISIIECTIKSRCNNGHKNLIVFYNGILSTNTIKFLVDYYRSLGFEVTWFLPKETEVFPSYRIDFQWY